MDDRQAKAAVKDTYDHRAEVFENVDFEIIDGERRIPEKRSAHYFVKRKVEIAMRMARANRSMKLLEVGCSLGQMTVLLATRFDDVTAIDLSPKCIDLNTRKFAQAGITNVSFITDDAEELATIPDGSMDLVVSFSAIRYCSDVQRAVNAAYAKLKPGGIAVIDFPNKHSPWHTLVKRAAGIETHVNDHLFSNGEVRAMFARAGFSDIQAKHILFIPRALPSRWFPLFRAANSVLERIPLLNRLSGVIMVMGRTHATSENSVGAVPV